MLGENRSTLIKQAMTTLAYKHIISVIDDYDVFLFDLWGVIIEGDRNYPGVVANINQLIKADKKVFFVTNAPRTAAFLQILLQSRGMDATEEMIISSGEIAMHMLHNSTNIFGVQEPLVYHLGRDTNNLIDQCLVPTTTNIHEANLVLLTLFCEETEKELLASSDDALKIASKQNVITLCANPDLGIMQQGIYRYCAGYFAKKIKQLGGRVVYIGKPYPEIYQGILDQLPHLPKNRILMIGDTFYTDILGANTIGIDSALVLTGNATPFHSAYDTLEKKLAQLTIAATEQKAMPNFVIQLGD